MRGVRRRGKASLLTATLAIAPWSRPCNQEWKHAHALRYDISGSGVAQPLPGASPRFRIFKRIKNLRSAI